MIAEALEFLTNLRDQRPITATVGGVNYRVSADRTLGEPIAPPAKPTLKLVTLTGFVDAYKAAIDSFPSKVAVRVRDHLSVDLVSLEADPVGGRHVWLTATCPEVNPFPFDTYQVPEMFLINLQSGFLPTDNVVALQVLASTLTNEGASIGTQDDGLSQTVTTKQGSVARAEVKLPPRIQLLAYRTFREIDPIASEFMLRLKGQAGQLPNIALLQIDGGRWKLSTMQVVALWLRKQLPDATVIA